MAYTEDYMDYGVGAETEEERRKRLEAEAAAQQGGATRPSLGDLASQYLGRRVDAAQQRVESAANVVSNPTEELQRRFGVTPDEAGNTEVQTQTTKTYADGSQEHVTKTQTPAPQASAPVAPEQVQPQPQMAAAPAPAAPVAPAPQPQAQAAPQPAPQPQVQAAPQVAPTAPINPAAPVPEIGQLPKAGPPVQVAGGVPGAGVAEAAQAARAVTPTGQPVVGAPQGGTSLAQMGAQAQVELQGQKYADQINAGGNQLYSLLTDGSGAPRMVQMAARDKIIDTAKEDKVKQDVEAKVNNIKDPNEVLKLFDEFKRSKSEDGSYLRAYLLKRFGFDAAGDDEMSKLGWGAKYEHTMLADGKEAMVKYSTKGEPIAGIDADGNKLSPKQLIEVGSLKGAQTGQTFHKNLDNDHTISHTVLPNGRGVVWKDETTGETLSKAPAKLSTISYQDPFEKMAMGASKTAMDSMRRENTKAQSQGAPAPYSEAQIQEAGINAASAVRSGRNVNLGAPTGVEPGAAAAGAAAANFSDPSIRVISPARTNAQQAALYQQSVDAGTPGTLPNGNPVAKPGTSLHEQGRAIDVDVKSLTPAGRRELAQKGYYQPFPEKDPGHFELLPGREAVSTVKTPASSDIARQARAIYDGDEKAPTGMGANNYRARAVMDEVHRIAQNEGTPFDPTKYLAREKTRKDYSGSGQAAKTVQSMNVAIDHLDTLQQTANALGNGNIPLFNKIANSYAKNTGSPAPTDFNSIKSIVGSEVAKAVAGGATALGDREEIRREIDSANSPAQLAGVINKYQQLLGGQLKGLRTNYESVGLKDFDSKLNARTREVLEKPAGSATGPIAGTTKIVDNITYVYDGKGWKKQ